MSKSMRQLSLQEGDAGGVIVEDPFVSRVGDEFGERLV